jgi:hypothetical protein
MKFQAFVFNWVGHEQNAVALERSLSQLCESRVINSDSSVEMCHADWHHIGDEAYFTEQWNTAVELFDADILFHIQADASFSDFPDLFQRCRFAVERHNCGVYAPNIDFTNWEYDRRKLRRIDDDLLEVPQTDCTCWAISRKVLDRLPPVNSQVCRFGWGIDFLAIATARALNMRAARDYRFTVAHPRSTGYDSKEAGRQLHALLESLPTQLRREVLSLQKEVRSKSARHQLASPLRRALRALKRLGWRGR